MFHQWCPVTMFDMCGRGSWVWLQSTPSAVTHHVDRWVDGVGNLADASIPWGQPPCIKTQIRTAVGLQASAAHLGDAPDMNTTGTPSRAAVCACCRYSGMSSPFRVILFHRPAPAPRCHTRAARGAHSSGWQAHAPSGRTGVGVRERVARVAGWAVKADEAGRIERAVQLLHHRVRMHAPPPHQLGLAR